MSYDFSAFCGNVIQLAAQESFPPELPVRVGCRAGGRRLGRRCLTGLLPRQSHDHFGGKTLQIIESNH